MVLDANLSRVCWLSAAILRRNSRVQASFLAYTNSKNALARRPPKQYSCCRGAYFFLRLPGQNQNV
jgi:hypothetical protein